MKTVLALLLCASSISWGALPQDFLFSSRLSKIVNLRKTGGIGTQVAKVTLDYYPSSDSCSFGAVESYDLTGTNFNVSDNVPFGITRAGVFNVYYVNNLSDPTAESIRVKLYSENNEPSVFSTAYAGNGSQTLCIQNVTCSAGSCSSGDSIPTQDFTFD